LRKLRQILYNLAANAAKFTHSGSIVLAGSWDLSPPTDGHWLVFSVSDTGTGIAPGDQPHIFERSFRGRNAERHPGTGLGLFISRKLSEALGGSISVSSQVGRGSRFTIRIPAALPAQLVEGHEEESAPRNAVRRSP